MAMVSILDSGITVLLLKPVKFTESRKQYLNKHLWTNVVEELPKQLPEPPPAGKPDVGNLCSLLPPRTKLPKIILGGSLSVSD